MNAGRLSFKSCAKAISFSPSVFSAHAFLAASFFIFCFFSRNFWYSVLFSHVCMATGPSALLASTAAMMALRALMRHSVLGFLTCSQNTSFVQGSA